MKITYFIDSPPDLAAGLHGFTDEITIEVKSGDAGGDGSDFIEHMKDALLDWYDGARVTGYVQTGETLNQEHQKRGN